MAPNILQLQREAESLSDERLLQEAQMPNMFPAYLTQQEMVRREQERNAYQARMAQQPGGTVHDRLIERAMSGIGSIPQQLSPEQEMFARQAVMEMSPEQMMQQQMMMQSPMPQPMADGGLVGYQHGGYHDPDDETPYEKAMRNRELRRERALELGAAGLGLGARFMGDLFTEGLGEYPLQGGYFVRDSSDGIAKQIKSYEKKVGRGDGWSMVDEQLAGGLEFDPRYVGPLSIPSVTESEGEGIASLIASMQAPVFGREAMDVSEYYEMTPEERRLFEFYGSGAQSLESRIDIESDRLSAQANILSNVARAMARGQVPTAGEPLRELQTAQRGRREGIMDESKAMEMAALAQEAGLSRAEQEALRERAMVEDERGYQEAQRQRLTEERLKFAEMLGSEDERERLMARVMLGVPSTDATGNALLDQRQRLLNQITELTESVSSEDPETMPDLRDQIVSMYSEQAAALGYSPERLRDIVEQSIIIRKPESKKLFNVEAQLPGAANGGLFTDTHQIEF